jgi:hypothetical protein
MPASAPFPLSKPPLQPQRAQGWRGRRGSQSGLPAGRDERLPAEQIPAERAAWTHPQPLRPGHLPRCQGFNPRGRTALESRNPAPAFFSPTNILITTQSGNIQRVQTFTLGEAYAINSKIVNTPSTSPSCGAVTTADMRPTTSTLPPWVSIFFRPSPTDYK